VSPSFGTLVLAAFTQRRKTLRNALRNVVEPALLERLGIDPGARPDTLAPASYAALARAVDGL
jgi:16S rRNA (adenine1518-N6/adenine1519-N6)-dimethyltransferase